jgi:hypothetical protein
MLIMPPGHAQEASRRRPLATRERWMIGGALASVAVVAIALVISIGTAGKSSAHGCIYATIPGAVGAQQISECGASARQTCRTVRAPGAFTVESARTIAIECRRAGLPVG